MAQQHLDLLRAEYVQLQRSHAELQRKHDVLEASIRLGTKNGGQGRASAAGKADESDREKAESARGFVQRLTETVSHLYDKDLYSDITIHCDGHQFRGHRLVISARTSYWADLSGLDRLDLEDLPYNVGQVLLRWVYTNELDERLGDSILLTLFGAAIKYRLEELKMRCDGLLVARVDVDNCVRIYQFAEEHGLERLRDCCSEMVAARWKEFRPEHFHNMDAPFLYKLLKRRSKNVLTSIIGLRREDVLFLHLIENENNNLKQMLNEPDPESGGQFPLELAFALGEMGMARSLVEHGANVNQVGVDGSTFLWKAIQNGSLEVCEFLVSDNGADVNYVSEKTGETLLHVLARSVVPDEIRDWAATHIARFELNALDCDKRTPLLNAIEHGNAPIFSLLMAQEGTQLGGRDAAGRTAIELALVDRRNLVFADALAKRGADLDSADSDGRTLLHKAVASTNLLALQFLAKHGADVNRQDNNGTAPLHLFLNQQVPLGQTAIGESQLDVLKVLLKLGADPTLRETGSGLTPIHFAVERGRDILELLLGSCRPGTPLNTLDKDGKSALWRALLAGKFDAARLLLAAGADVNEKSPGGELLLIRAIHEKRDDIARFLLENKAIAAVTSPDGFTCLNLAVEQGLTPTVDLLCRLGANLNQVNPRTGLVPLWTALEKADFGTAEVLVSNGCDVEGWAPNLEDTLDQSLLHRAIDTSNRKAAVFLIKNRCNVNAMPVVRDAKVQNQKPNASEIFAASRQTPLHMSVQWGLTEVTTALVSNLNCKIDVQDSEGRTAAHIAVIERDQATLELLLSHPDPACLSVRDRYGQTPLALAMANKDNKAAEAICRRLPHAAVQTNGRGENLLHVSVRTTDFEAVLFLLGIQVDVNIPVQDQQRDTALHICAEFGNELVLRNLILAGGRVNTQNAHGDAPLHVAARHGQVELCSALLENGVDPNLANADGNNALHVAVAHGQVEVTRLLLVTSDDRRPVDYFAFNKRQQNILHLCATNIGLVSAEVFLTIMEAHPDFPLEMVDMFGNSMFLLAYINGNSELCRMALRDGCCLGAMNHQGQTVFNVEMPTKQLLFSLLDGLEKEPRWAEGDCCSECMTRFTLTMRKHHCRHCGRLACAKCTEQQLPLLKYNVAKPARVCQICFDVLTIGGTIPGGGGKGSNSHFDLTTTASSGNGGGNGSINAPSTSPLPCASSPSARSSPS